MIRPALLACLVALTSCQLPVTKSVLTPQDERLLALKRPAMAQAVVLDVVPLPADEKPTMWDIAQTIPAYDWSINAFHRDGLTTEDETTFRLKGDGSQTPVEIVQKADAKPVRIEVAIGPIHDGFGYRMPKLHYTFKRVDGGIHDGFGYRMPKLHYTFKRVDGGWKRLDWHVTYHGRPVGDGTYSPALSDEENRARIESITGKPYDDGLQHVEESLKTLAGR